MMAYIDWLDHHGYADGVWKTAAELTHVYADSLTIRTYGEIAAENEDVVVVITERYLDPFRDDPIYRYTIIMKKLIVKRGD